MSTQWDDPQLTCKLPLGQTRLVAHNELLLSGWAVSPRGISGVAVQIGERQWNASYGLDTPADAPPEEAESPNTGQSGYQLRIDTSDWRPGPCYVTISALDHEGRRGTIEGPVEVRPFVAPAQTVDENRELIAAGRVTLSLDAPRPLNGSAELESPVAVEGWAYAKDGIEAVIVTVDGCLQHEALRPVARPDLLLDFGSGVALDAGFVSLLDSTECGPGRHSLTVVALGSNGEAAGVQGELVCRPASPNGEAAAEVVPRGVLVLPRERDAERDPADERTHWEDRALLAEANAAESRNAARLIQESQRGFTRAWREVEARARNVEAVEGELGRRTEELEEARGYLRGAEGVLEKRTEELDEARGYLRGAEGELEKRTAELDEARSGDHELEVMAARLAQRELELAQRKTELEERREEVRNLELVRTGLEHQAAEFESVKRSLSWRITRPLRFVRGLLRRLVGRPAKLPRANQLKQREVP